MENLQKSIGRRVRELRVRKGLTQENLAGEAEMDFKYTSAVEAGRLNITLRNLSRIATALDVPVYKLFVNTKEKPAREDHQVSRLISLLSRTDSKMRGHLIRLLQHHLRLANTKSKKSKA